MRGDYYPMVMHRFGWQLLVLVYVGGNVQDVFSFFVSWLCLKPIYEIGYIFNDFWSERREMSSEFKGKPISHVGSLSVNIWIKLIAFRLVFSLGMGILLWQIVPSVQQVETLYGIIFFTAFCFALHNTLPIRLRPITYFLLHLSKAALFFPLVHATSLTLPISVCIISPTIATTAYYLGHKGFSGFVPHRAFLGLLVGQLRLSILLMTVSLLALWAMRAEPDPLLLNVIGYYVAFDIFASFATFRKATRRSHIRRDIIQHVHSEYSHDSVISLADTPQHASDAGFATCYMTEHAEDFDAVRYDNYVRTIRALNGIKGRCILVPGLEYPILRQHILACNSIRYIDVDSTQVESINHVKAVSERVVWAHPMIATRRLYDFAYIMELFAIARRVDCVEWASGKYDRPDRYFARRHLIAALIIHIIWPTKELWFGYDVHKVEDWKRIPRLLGC